MRRLTIACLVIILLVAISLQLPTLAQPIQLPHENPATAHASFDTAALLLVYSSSLTLAAASQYDDAMKAVSLLENVRIPDELRYLTDRYNALFQQFFTTLDNLEATLDEATGLLDDKRIDDAQLKLSEAETLIQDAQFMSVDIEVVTAFLGDEIGVLAAPAASRLGYAFGQLEDSLTRLRLLLQELNRFWQRLGDSYQTQKEALIPTGLSLIINPSTAFVGDSVTAWGRLNAEGQPLANKRLLLIISEESIAATTDSNGRYQAEVTIPYKYVSGMSLRTMYLPSADDRETYQAGESSPAMIDTMFYPTFLQVSVPEIINPKLPIIIDGQVSSTEGTMDRTVGVFLDDDKLYEERVSDEFRFELTVPKGTSPGEHDIRLAATSEGRHAGASTKVAVNIARIPLWADISLPRIHFLPRPVRITGKIYDESGPNEGASITLRFKDSVSNIKTDIDGSFTALLDAPIDLSLINPREIAIEVVPVDSWYTPLELTRPILAINPLTTGLMLAILIMAAAMARRMIRLVPAEEKAVGQPGAIVLPAIIPVIEHGERPNGIRGRILASYQSVLRTLEKTPGITMAPHNTVREFLEIAAAPPLKIHKSFAGLTSITEIALYSATRLNEAAASRAEQLASTIKEEMLSGTP